MAEEQGPSFTAGGCTTAHGDRMVLASLVCAEGVAGVDGGSLQVTPGGVGLSVDVASGAAFVEGTEITEQGMYHVFNDAPETITLAAADVTDPRIDLIIARVYDAEYSGVLSEWHLEAVTGTPSPVPAAPSLPDNSLVLAQVRVTAGATSVTGGNITDARAERRLCGPDSLIDVLVYTANGTFDPDDYPSMTAIVVKGTGGGGGGGGVLGPVGPADTGAAAGSGGGAGYGEALIQAADLSGSVSVVIGQGGEGGHPAAFPVEPAEDGTATTFGSFLVANGGEAGTDDYDQGLVNAVKDGGAGGTVTGTRVTVNIRGQKASPARVVNGEPFALPGGDSHLGYGAAVPLATNGDNGSAALGFGGGGGGAFKRGDTGGASSYVGGDGKDGYLTVEVHG